MRRCDKCDEMKGAGRDCCPSCGADLRTVTKRTVPDFPNELVEAAAKALADSDTGYFLPYRGERDAALTVLAAVLPLIEQRVIDRLAAGDDERMEGR